MPPEEKMKIFVSDPDKSHLQSCYWCLQNRVAQVFIDKTLVKIGVCVME